MILAKYTGAFVILLTLPFPLLANDVYLGSKVGWVHGFNACEPHRLTCDNDALGAGLFLGYELNDWLALEAGYNYLGKMKANYPAIGNKNITAPYSGKVQGLELGVKPYWGLSESTSVFSKVGTLAWKTAVTGNEINYLHTANDRGWSPMIGVGIEATINHNLSTRLEYQWFPNVGGSGTGGSSINMLSIGISYYFNYNSIKTTALTAPIQSSITPIEAITTSHEVNSYSILFTSDSATLTPTMIEVLQPIIKQLQDYPKTKLIIQAHTDSSGTSRYNKTLSERRGMAVKNYYISQGIAPSQLIIDAKGETQPAFDNITKHNRAQNRRVVLIYPAYNIKNKTN